MATHDQTCDLQDLIRETLTQGDRIADVVDA